MIKECLVFGGLGFSFSLLLYFLLLKSSTIRVHKQNTNAERWAAQSKPLFGGIGFMGLFVLAILYWFTFVPHTVGSQYEVLSIVIVVAISFFMGLIDDIRHSSPYFKLAIQAISALILIKSNIYISIFDTQALNYTLTIFWVIGIMNSINMLDNMDAITTTNSLIIISSITAIQVITNNIDHFLFITSVGAIASLVAFLIWNWNPAKMYMGDNGSQFLGAILAILSIKFIWNIHLPTVPSAWYQSFIMVGLLFIVPLSDTTTVTINRLKIGKSPFVGGRDHTTHHLSYCGLSDRWVAILLASISVVTNIIFFYIYFQSKSTISFTVVLIAEILIFIALYSTTIFGKRK